MSRQYLLLSEILTLLKKSPFVSHLLRTETLIYHLKLVLLTAERCGSREINRVCPIESLQDLQRLILDTKTTSTTPDQIESLLKNLIQQVESALPSTSDIPRFRNSGMVEARAI